MQDKYRELYPDMVGAATTTPTTLDLSFGKDKDTTESAEVTETIETTVEETLPVPVIMETTESTTATTETTEQVNTPDTFEEQRDVHFYNSYPLQTISHEERDMRLDVLKQNILDYGNNNPNLKISFSYINLRYGESMGLNDLEPIVPSGAWALPMAILYDENCANGIGSFQRTVTYMGDLSEGNSSYIVDNYSAGKQFYMRTLLNLAVANNDSLALEYIINSLGGINSACGRLASISSYINFTDTVIYTDYSGVQQRGNYRTTTYDMANYIKYFYYGYINHPSTYQTLLNDLYYSNVPSPYSGIFGAENVFHISGRNELTHSYIDAAIIDGDEPFVLVISVEAPSYDQSQIAIADLATYLQRYISSCHEAQ